MSVAMSDAERWGAVLARDGRSDGSFVYAVRSTGIFCRPSCPSRRPRADQVSFFPLPEVAMRAGYRPCKRCHPEAVSATDPQVDQMRELCRYIEAHLDEPLTLQHLGAEVGLSPTHLQRTFKAVVGISPQRYLEACRVGQLRSALQAGETISEALYQAGWGSPSRLYSRANAHLGMTPATYQQGGKAMEIRYTIHPSPLGALLVAATARGICAVLLGESEGALEAALRSEFQAATLSREADDLTAWVEAILAHLAGELPHLALPLDVRATAFQRRVWEALQAIPYGETRSYAEIAAAIEAPTATRAVAQACARNPAALVIPCHRVVRSDGSLGGYRWGVDRKAQLLEAEAAAASAALTPLPG